MNFYRRWIASKEEEGAAAHRPFKLEHPFAWGLQHLGFAADTPSPKSVLRDYTKHALDDSMSYFVPPRLASSGFVVSGCDVVYPSALTSADAANNTVRCRFFPGSDRRGLVIVVPHWNSESPSYDTLCRHLTRAGFSALRFELPYHEHRSPFPADGNGRGGGSTRMVSADIGLTLQAMRQAVQDVIRAIDWATHQGFERIGLLGASIGSCVAFLAAVHEPRVAGFFGNLMSSYFGDVVWTGISTTHIRKSLEGQVTLGELREAWLLNSPIAFVDTIRTINPTLRLSILSARYDQTFPYPLTELFINALTAAVIPFTHRILPCGHYTLGESCFRLTAGYHIFTFFKHLFRSPSTSKR